MIKIGKKTISIPMILFMYMLIYNPPILAPLFRNNSAWLVILPSIAYVLLHRKELKEFTNLRAVIRTEVILVIILVYLITVAKINGNPLAAFGFYVYWTAGVIPFALSCWICLRKRGLGIAELLDHLLITGLVMAATSVAAFLIPSVKEFFTEKMIDYGMSRIITIKLSAYRDFGLAANLTSTTAYAQAAMACIALWRGMREKPSWLLAFPVLAFSANINIRTAVYLILAGMGAVFAGLVFTKDWKRAAMFAGTAVVSIAAAYFGLGLIRLVNPMTYEWLDQGLEQVSTFVAGSEVPGGDSYFDQLAWMLSPDKFPHGAGLVFGVGTEVMGTVAEGRYGVSSDVGFMNDIWSGGILYLTVLIGLYTWILWKIVRSRTVRRGTGIFLAVLFLLFFVITNIKGFFFIHSDLTAIIWILIIPLVLNREGTWPENTMPEKELIN